MKKFEIMQLKEWWTHTKGWEAWDDIREKFDDFYQCEYAKLEYELKIRSQSSDAIIEKYKEKEQDLDDMEIEM